MDPATGDTSFHVWFDDFICVPMIAMKTKEEKSEKSCPSEFWTMFICIAKRSRVPISCTALTENQVSLSHLPKQAALVLSVAVAAI